MDRSTIKMTPVPALDGRSSAAQFLEDHERLTLQVKELEEHNTSLRTQCASLAAEVNMLREELDRTDKARIQIQGFASGMMTRLEVINTTIQTAIREASSHKIKEPTPVEKPEDTKSMLSMIAKLPANSLTQN